MSLTVEEIQRTLTESMMSMQAQMEIERKSYKEEIKNLKNTIEEKEEIISELSSRKGKDIAIRNYELENERLRKELDSKITEYKTAMINVSTLNNQIELKKQNIMQLNLEKRQLQEKLNEATKQNNAYKNQSPELQKQIEENKKEIQKNKEEIEEKEKIISELNEKIQKMENDNNNLAQKNEEMAKNKEEENAEFENKIKLKE